MRLRWKIGLTVAAVLGPILAGLGVAPYLVNVEAYKPAMIEAVRQATGRELVIDGPMKLSVFPVPGIGAGTVRFSNAVGAKGAQMIDVRWVAVTPSWLALLQGRIEVGTLKLYRPTIVLETDANGRPNWQFDTPSAAQAADSPSAGLQLAVGRVEIVDGTVRYTNPRDGKSFSATEVNAGFTVSSFDGPFDINGRGTVNGIPLKLDLSVGANTDAGHKASLSLEVSSGKLDFEGWVAAIAANTKMQGHLSVKTGLLSDFVNSIVSATGSQKPAFDTSGAGNFAFEGDIDLGPDHIAANNFDVSMGKDGAKGSLALAFQSVPTVSGHVALSRLDIGTWLTILARPIDFAPDPVKAVAVATAGAANKAAATIAKVVTGPSPWSQIDADVSVDVAEAIYRHDTIRDLSVVLDVDKGVVGVPRFKASLPGGMSVDADTTTGQLKLVATDLRHTLDWLGLETAGVPAGKLEAFSLDGKLAAAPGGLALSDGTFKLDGTPGTIAGTLSFKSPLAATLDLGMDQGNLDDYMPPPAETAPTETAAPVTSTPPVQKATAQKPAPPTAAGATGAAAQDQSPSLGMKLKIAKLLFHGETLNGVEGTATVQGTVLKLSDIKVADLLGAKLSLQGTVNDFGTLPRFDLAFNVAAPDTDRLLDYAGLPKFLNGRIGPATATGSVAGTREAVAVRDVAAHFLDSDGHASGKLTFSSPTTFDFPQFSLQTQDASRLVSVASGQSTKGIGPISATGALKGSSERAVFTGELNARGSDMNGTLDATLGKRPRVLANLKVPGTLDIDSLLGIEDDSAPPPPPPGRGPQAPEIGPAPQIKERKATAKPINLTALRSFDATLTVSAKAMSMAALKVDYADLDATLLNGVMKVTKLTGQFYTGAVAFTGTIDASGKALSIDATGDLRGIGLGRMLQGTMNNNAFGPADFKVGINGKVDATGIHLTGQGDSATELREGLAGTATLGGYVHPVMADGVQSLAKFATGIGSLFSNALAFDSLILQNFINYKAPVSGRVQLANGHVTLEDVVVKGQSATATINSDNHLADGTTNTTVDLVSGGSQYVAKVTGPLALPTIDPGKALPQRK